MKKTDTLSSPIVRASRVGAGLGAAMLVALMLLVAVEVVLRRLFGGSTYIADEFSIYFFVGLTYLAAAHTLEVNRHIRIDTITRHVGAKYQWFFAASATVVTLLVSLFLSWRAWVYVWRNYRLGLTAATLVGTPLYIPALAMSLGLTILALQGAFNTVKVFMWKGIKVTHEQ